MPGAKRPGAVKQVVFSYTVEPLAAFRFQSIPARVEVFKPGHPELVNENETPPATIYCSAGSLFGDAGLLIQTAGGRAAGCGIFPLNRFGCIP